MDPVPPVWVNLEKGIIRIENCHYSNEHLEILTRELSTSTWVKELSFNYNTIDEIPKQIDTIRCLTTGRYITNLDLSRNDFGSESIRVLADVLTIHSTLTHLNIGFNPIGNTGLEYLSRSLMINSVLKSLNVQSCGIDDMSSLIQTLKHNRTLKILRLSFNTLPGSALGEILRTDNGVKEIFALMCGFEVDDYSYIIDGLRHNKTLKLLHIERNETMKDDQIEKLIDILHVHPTITSLSISSEGIRPFISAIREGLKLSFLRLENDNDYHDDREFSTGILEAVSVNPNLTKISLPMSMLLFDFWCQLNEYCDRNLRNKEQRDACLLWSLRFLINNF